MQRDPDLVAGSPNAGPSDRRGTGPRCSKNPVGSNSHRMQCNPHMMVTSLLRSAPPPEEGGATGIEYSQRQCRLIISTTASHKPRRRHLHRRWGLPMIGYTISCQYLYSVIHTYFKLGSPHRPDRRTSDSYPVVRVSTPSILTDFNNVRLCYNGLASRTRILSLIVQFPSGQVHRARI